MTVTFWIVLLVLAAALAIATMRRKRPESRLAEAQRLPPRDDLSGLGLSSVRPATPREAAAREAVAVPTAGSATAARPASAARPVALPVATPVARPSSRVDSVLDDLLADTPADEPLDARHLGLAEIDGPPAAAPAEPAPSEPAPSEPVPSEPADAAERDDAPPAEVAGDGAPDPEAADAVWTFDRDAAEGGSDSTPRTAYVRDGQALWPADAAPAALLAASLAARLGGSVAVVRHDAATEPEAYLVELLAGPAAAADPAPIPALGHPLHRVPQDGVLSLLGASTDLPYRSDAPVGQVLVCSLGAPPSARVLLVADVPPDAPDVDGATAALVDGYAALLADLTEMPPAETPADERPADARADADRDRPPDARPTDADDARHDDARHDDARHDDARETSADGSAADGPGETEASGDGDASEEADAQGDASEPAPPAGLTPARDTTVAQPGARRGAAPPPPRGVILAGEIAAARRDRRLLVFALATVADAETVLRGGADGVVRAEAALRQRLTAGPGVRRVEPFGDLLFGVFLDAEGPEVVAWAERLSAQGRPLLVGAVPAVGAPALVRATATAALQSAYEREVVCVVAS